MTSSGILALLAIATIAAAEEVSDGGYYYKRPEKVFIEGSGQEDNTLWNNSVTQYQFGANYPDVSSKDSCGETYRAPAFRVTSPGYPNPAPPSIVCSYVIEAFSPRVCQLEVTFPSLEVDCDGDVILTVLGERVCGPTPRTFPFTQARDVIYFRGDSKGRRFDLRVRQIECDRSEPTPNCGGVFNQPQFTLQSPNYPLPYPPTSHCEYLIRASNQGICDLDFYIEDFNVGSSSSPDCSSDRLEIGDQKPLCGQKSGRIRYHDFLGELRVKFISDRVGTDTGFKILVTQVPCASQNLSQPLANSDDTSRIFPIRPTPPPYCPPNQPHLPGPPIFPPIYPPTHNHPPIHHHPPINPYPPPNPPIYPPNHNHPPINPYPPPNPPIYPPIYPPFPPIYPPVQPAPPIYVIPIPPNLPQCCIRPYNDQNFFISSPNFPHTPQGNIDCIFAIRRFNPQTCRLRLHFRYFWVGEDRNGCNGGFLNLDGRLICGCHTGQSLVVGFDQWEAVKLMRYKTSAGFGKNKMQGFVIEVQQEECFRYKRDSNVNVTIDQNYRKTRFNHYFNYLHDNEYSNNNNPAFASNQSQDVSTNFSKDSSSYDNHQPEPLINQLERSHSNYQNVLNKELPIYNSAYLALSPPIFPPSNLLANHTNSTSAPKLEPSNHNQSEKPHKVAITLPSTNLQLPSGKPSAFNTSKFTITYNKTSSTSSTPTELNKASEVASNMIPETPSRNSDLFSYGLPLNTNLPFESSPSLPSPPINDAHPSVTSQSKEDRFWQPSCLASGFKQWLILAKEFLWSGQASCPSRPPVPPPVPVLPPIFPPVSPPGQRCIVMDQPRGVIQSYGYPRGYPNNVNCCYRFQAAPGICRIELIIIDFHLENSKFCFKDYFLIGGKKRYCGTSLAGTTTTFDTSRVKYVMTQFVTDSQLSGRGFRGEYRQLPCAAPPPPTSCNHVVTGVNFHLSHVTTCENDARCVFSVVKVAPEICQFQLAFSRFSLVCGREVLEVAGERLCGELTGQTRIFNVPGNALTMVFRSSLGSGRGFELYGTQVAECEPLIPFWLDVPPARLSEERPLKNNTTQPRGGAQPTSRR